MFCLTGGLREPMDRNTQKRWTTHHVLFNRWSERAHGPEHTEEMDYPSCFVLTSGLRELMDRVTQKRWTVHHVLFDRGLLLGPIFDNMSD